MQTNADLLTEKDWTLVAYALRTFVRDYDGAPSSPTGPSQSEVDHAKRLLRYM